MTGCRWCGSPWDVVMGYCGVCAAHLPPPGDGDGADDEEARPEVSG